MAKATGNLEGYYWYRRSPDEQPEIVLLTAVPGLKVHMIRFMFPRKGDPSFAHEARGEWLAIVKPPTQTKKR